MKCSKLLSTHTINVSTSQRSWPIRLTVEELRYCGNRPNRRSSTQRIPPLVGVKRRSIANLDIRTRMATIAIGLSLFMAILQTQSKQRDFSTKVEESHKNLATQYTTVQKIVRLLTQLYCYAPTDFTASMVGILRSCKKCRFALHLSK